jgi:hypothetical protein
VRYYLERREPEFNKKMAEALCVYREVKIIKETAKRRGGGIHRIATTRQICRLSLATRDLPRRDHEISASRHIQLVGRHRLAHR